ncbi:MAG: hypothetical protein CML68_11450 [Rhodobacteraceae bacterium]|nr:hypothetical protein [Paracoccaceae bacterium]
MGETFGKRRVWSGLAAVVLACAGLGLSGQALACGFHATTPEKSAVDWLLEADQVVVARNTPENPFAYVPVDIIAGSGPEVAIDMLVDSGTRRFLAMRPNAGVLFVHIPADGSWKRLAYLTSDYRQVVDKVLARKPDWTSGYTRERLAMFEALQIHPSAELRRLALLELDKAPYDQRRASGRSAPADGVHGLSDQSQGVRRMDACHTGRRLGPAGAPFV